MKVDDTLIALPADSHTGSSMALFPNRFWQNEHQNHTPNKKQQEIYAVFERCMEYARERRKNKRMIVIHMGDSIEGVHHNSQQICITNKDAQAELHQELMDEFLTTTKFSRKSGDRLFYVRGTETHVEDKESEIAKDLGAETTPEGNYVFDHLELTINGRLIWLVHHGKNRGKGAAEGNALRNFLRDIHFDCEKIGKRFPDIVVSGHVHAPTYSNYVYRKGMDFHIMHGIICPSWQAKTRYAYKVAPVDVNEIGCAFLEISAAGDIRVPHFILQDTKQNDVVMV